MLTEDAYNKVNLILEKLEKVIDKFKEPYLIEETKMITWLLKDNIRYLKTDLIESYEIIPDTVVQMELNTIERLITDLVKIRKIELLYVFSSN